MQNETKSFRTFEDLEVYPAARQSRMARYGVARVLTAYGLTDDELDAILSESH